MDIIATRVAARFQPKTHEPDPAGTPLRVAARFQKKARGDYDGKLIGKDCRLQWSRYQWLLEELPQKGKKKLRTASLQNPNYSIKSSAMLAVNVMQRAKLSRSDSYDRVKKKLLDAMSESVDLFLKGEAVEWDEARGRKGTWDWVKKDVKWYESQVYFLEVIPEDVDPFDAKGKDFSISISWTKWSAYRHLSKAEEEAEEMHAHQGDPSGSSITSKSKGSARKMYKTLTADPNALKSVTWKDFDKWLDTRKIGYDYRHSVWR